MAYEKQNFTDGEILTSRMLNKIEDGIVQNEKDIKKLSENNDYIPKSNIGDSLMFDEHGKLNVRTASSVEEDNTLPITSAAVAVTVGNIDALLATI